MLLPTGKIADTALADNGGPVFASVEDGVVQSERKKQGCANMPMFEVKGGVDFFFDPGAGQGVLGEHEQEFVVLVDGAVDLGTQFVAGLEILGCQPAGDAAGSEVGVESIGKRFICGDVADDATLIM